jgi:hypothetical protein
VIHNNTRLSIDDKTVDSYDLYHLKNNGVKDNGVLVRKPQQDINLPAQVVGGQNLMSGVYWNPKYNYLVNSVPLPAPSEWMAV